jgi:uncharacterized repeat protein (TIGR03803 family)
VSQSIEAVSRFRCFSTSPRGLFYLLLLSGGFAIALFGAVPGAVAQLTILHSFGDGTVPNDGSDPRDGLIQTPDGTFYGVTLFHAGRAGARGVIFSITSSGTYSIPKNYAHPSFTSAPLYYNKKLIGTYYGQNAKNAGVLFSLSGYPNGPWLSHVWHVFTGEPADGEDPVGRLILGSDGNLYGVTEIGGSANQGTIYKVNPKSHAVEIVYSFPSNSSLLRPSTGLLLAADGNFYGAAEAVGNNPGEIYKMTPSGAVTTFYQFTGSGFPWGALIQGSDGNFYGTAVGTSSNMSFVYRLTPRGVLKVLHKFTPTQGPGVITTGVVQGPNGYLYGLSWGDGTGGMGTVYELSTDGSTFNVLHYFGDGSVPNDGKDPDGILTVGTDGNLYGVTTSGGSAGNGTVFKISP